MSTNHSEIELTDQEIEDYLSVALSAKTVTPDERKHLAPLLKFYAKKPHPFTACVKDNRKRFGPKTEAYCAVLKDLIVGNTKWRHGGNHTAKGAAMSEAALKEIFQIDAPDGFGHWLSELDVNEIVSEEVVPNTDNLDFAQILSEAGTLLAQGEKAAYADLGNVIQLCNSYIATEPDPEDKAVMQGIVKKLEVLYAKDKTEFSDDEDHLLAEMYFAAEGDQQVKPDEDGLLWKTILREGKWKYSPGAGGAPKATPITVTFDGESNPAKKIISMTEVKNNFDAGAIEHVTIPTSHADSVLENTGFIKKLRFGVDEKGRNILEAGHEFRDPAVKEKAQSGAIANTSAGILFDYIHKETGKKFRSVLAHVALTNRPWLNGMKPFGVNASENITVMGFSEESINDDPADVGGGDNNMSEVTYDFTSLGFSSEEELKSALEERAELKSRERERDVADLCQKWQGEGKTPALVAEAKAIMMSDEGSNVVNLSEDGKTVGLSASDIVKRLVDKAVGVKLTDDPVSDENMSEDAASEEEEVELSQEERVIASQLFFSGLSDDEAVKEAKRRVAAGTK